MGVAVPHARHDAVRLGDDGVIDRGSVASAAGVDDARPVHHDDAVRDVSVIVNCATAPRGDADATVFDYRAITSPPADWDAWAHLIEAFTRHCVDRYGIDEVRRWGFEVWNEPNYAGFWTGTMEDYFTMYDAAAAGASLYAFHCFDDSPLFVVTWYTLAAIPDRSYATLFQTVIEDCKANGAFAVTML